MRSKKLLTKSRDYLRVYQEGSARTNRLFVIRVATSPNDYTRYGITVSKRVGNAVMRNHVKRRLREIMKNVTLKPSRDTVLVARPPVASASYGEMKDAVLDLLTRTNLLLKNR